MSDGLKVLLIRAMVLGSCLPPFAVVVRVIPGWWTFRCLEPLWQELTSAVPHALLHAAPEEVPRLSLGFRRRLTCGDVQQVAVVRVAVGAGPGLRAAIPVAGRGFRASPARSPHGGVFVVVLAG